VPLPLQEARKEAHLEESEVAGRLKSFRKRIDNLDADLIHILAERFLCTDEVGMLKATQALSSRDKAREERQFERARNMVVGAGSDPQIIEDILRFIIQIVVGRHKRIAKNTSWKDKG
jgi:chorismate mutase